MSIATMRPWLVAVLTPFALLAITVPIVAAAPRAHADASSDIFYIDLLKGSDEYNRHGEQALLQEGHKVCDAMQHGASEEGATKMVQSDLGGDNYQAYWVVSSIELGMNCFSLKPYGMP
ncbi:DUF732 domain-containing protein [Mycobacterium avium]|uniref:DUF732 domain-containing protein n=1 Tax=Mycobacterium avium TaxID=1764 RepID=UPI001CC4286D|nr:DUF732 domain-containing protein [Mycobacterium avium]